MILFQTCQVNAQRNFGPTSCSAFGLSLGSRLHGVVAMQITCRREWIDLPMDLSRRQFAVCLIALVLLTAPIGCAGSNGGTSTEMSERLAGAPAWLTEGCRSHWKTAQARRTVVCGVGSAGPNRNRIAARDTAIARARSAIARSIEVTIESLVRVEDSNSGDGELHEFIHQLTSESLPSCQLESVWRSETGEVHALVSLRVAKVERSVRETRVLSPDERADLAKRTAEALAVLDSNPGDHSAMPSEVPGSENGGGL